MKLILISIILIILSGCSLQQEISKSDDFGNSIILERSGMYTLPEYAVQLYTLTQTNLKVQVYSFDGSLTKEVNFSIHPGITYSVFEEFERVNFSNLETRYQSKVNIADIGQGVITYKNHSVLIMPYIGQGNPSEISDIITIFDDLLSQVNTSEVFLPQRVEENEVITYTFTGVQCVEEPWMINSPTREAQWMKIQKYYSEQGIEIEVIKRIDSELAQCQACEVCSKGYSYEIQVNGYQEVLENDGWIISN